MIRRGIEDRNGGFRLLTSYRLIKEREGVLNDKRFPVLDMEECHYLIWKSKGIVVGKITSSG